MSLTGERDLIGHFYAVITPPVQENNSLPARFCQGNNQHHNYFGNFDLFIKRTLIFHSQWVTQAFEPAQFLQGWNSY